MAISSSCNAISARLSTRQHATAASLAAAGYLPARNIPAYAVEQWRAQPANTNSQRGERARKAVRHG